MARPGAQITYVAKKDKGSKSGMGGTENLSIELSFNDYSPMDQVGALLGLQSQQSGNTNKSFELTY